MALPSSKIRILLQNTKLMLTKRNVIYRNSVRKVSNLNSFDPIERELRCDLTAAYRWCDRIGLNEGVDNHLTVALPCNQKFLVIPQGIHWSALRASQLLLVDGVGNVLCGGEGEPELTAVKIHSSIHQILGKRATCVMHTHQTFTSTICAIQEGKGGKILPVHQNSSRFLNNVAYDRTFGGIVDNDEEGRRLAKAFGDNTILLSWNHGPLVAESSVALALDDLYFLEKATELQVHAMSAVGGDIEKLQYIDEEQNEFTYQQFQKLKTFYANLHFKGIYDVLVREGSDFNT